MSRFYTAPDGARYPLTEAKYDMAFRVYKSDRRKAKANDPHGCLLALGVRRDRDVQDVYIGSGLDAYVVFKKDGDQPAHAVHFTIGTPTRRVIDAFDKDKKAVTQQIILRKPTKGRTLDAREVLNTRRHKAIRNGTHTVKTRSTAPRRPRIQRLGVHGRPRPRISESGNVNATVEQESK